jgi:hypothetical protein
MSNLEKSDDFIGLGVKGIESAGIESAGFGYGGIGGRPTLSPSLDLQFAKTKSLTAVKGPTPQFSRASTATYRDSSNVLQTAAIGVPRFHHDESLTGSTATVTSSVFNGVLPYAGLADYAEQGFQSPKFENNDFVLFLDLGNWYVINKNENQSASASVQLNLRSLGLLIEAPATNLVLNSNDIRFATNVIPVVNLSASTKTYAFSADAASSNATSIYNDDSDEYYDFPPKMRSFFYFIVAPFSTLGLQVIFGSIKNIQVEEVVSGESESTGATSYIPTGATTVTRAADVCSITGSAFSGFFNASAGTLSVQTPRSLSSNASYVILSDGNLISNSIRIGNFPYESASPNRSEVLFFSAGNQEVYFSFDLYDEDQKTATAYSINDFAACHNGGTTVFNDNGFLPTGINQMLIGYSNLSAKNYYSNNCISSIQYYPKRLSDSKLQSLTA